MASDRLNMKMWMVGGGLLAAILFGSKFVLSYFGPVAIIGGILLNIGMYIQQ